MQAKSTEPTGSKLSEPDRLRKIRINYGDDKDDFVNMVVQGNLVKRKTLDDNFDEGCTLTYRNNGEPFLLESDDQYIFIDSVINTYDLKRGPGSKKRKRFDELMDILHTGKTELNEPSTSKKKALTGHKIGNKKQTVPKIDEDSEVPLPLPFEKRVIYVGWKHKMCVEDPYVYMGSILAPVIKVIVNKNEEYSIDKLKSIIIENYINEDYKSFFNNCIINIGTASGTIIHDFVHEDKNSFWEYSKLIRESNHKLRINIYTEKKVDTSSNSIQVDSKEQLPCPSDKSKTGIVYQQVVSNEQLSLCPSDKTDQQQKTLYEKCQSEKLVLQDISNHTDEGKNLSKNHTTKDSFLDQFPSCSWMKNMKCDNEQSILESEANVSSNLLECRFKKKCAELQQQPLLSTQAIDSFNHFEKSIESPVYSAITIKKSQKNSVTSSTNVNKPSKMSNQPESTIDKKSYNISSDSSGDSFNFLELNDRVHKKIESSHLSIQMIKPNELQFSNIIIGKGGQGTIFTVFRGKYLGSHVAIKCVQKGAADKSALKEITLLNKIHHPNIILIMGVCSTYCQTQIVMEYFESLFTILFDLKVKKYYDLDDKSKAKISYQIAYALSYLHLQPVSILHRDMKPNNVLVNQNLLVKICDLGLADSKSLDESLQSTRNSMQGTYLFMAPEILMHSQKATTKSDVWSYACTITSLYTASPVWDMGSSPSGFHIAYKNFEAKNIPKYDKAPMCLQAQLKRCFNYDPQCRPNIMELLHFFEKLLQSA